MNDKMSGGVKLDNGKVFKESLSESTDSVWMILYVLNSQSVELSSPLVSQVERFPTVPSMQHQKDPTMKLKTLGK